MLSDRIKIWPAGSASEYILGDMEYHTQKARDPDAKITAKYAYLGPVYLKGNLVDSPELKEIAHKLGATDLMILPLRSSTDSSDRPYVFEGHAFRDRTK
jgi:hypothetical protein